MASLPQVGGDAGNWGNKLNEFLLTGHNSDGTHKDVINVRDFGAINAAVAAIGSTQTTLLVSNAQTLTANLTIPSTLSLIISKGGSIVKASTYTLTINGTFEAGLYQVFSGFSTGDITFAVGSVKEGYPEWWGAVADNGAVGQAEELAAIENCFSACCVTRLQPADYSISSILKLNTSNRTLVGSGWDYIGAGTATRILVPDGSSTVIQVGLDTQPGGGINDFLQAVTVSNLMVGRAVAPVIASNCVGIRSQYTLYQKMDNISSVGSMRGFEFIGTVGSQFNNLWTSRTLEGTGGGADYWRGYYINGTHIVASGGNASIYLNYIQAGITAGLLSDSTGILIDDAWADTFITQPEIGACVVGIAIQGDSDAAYGYGEVDLHIIKPVIDTYSFAGIYILNLSKYGAISINGGYAAPGGGTTPTASIYVKDSNSPVSINNFQHILGPAVTPGLVIINSSNVTSIGNIYSESSSSPISMDGASNCVFMDRSTNYSKVASAVVYMTNSTRNKFEMTCSGASNKVTLGYRADSTGNEYNEFNCTGLDPNCINGGSANKLVINGVQITTAGLSGNNLASGVMD